MDLDCCRKSIASLNAAAQLAVWDQIQDRFRVLRVKNTSTGPLGSAETFRMMQILVNVLLELTNEDAAKSPMTYGDMIRHPRFEKAIDAACEANPWCQYTNVCPLRRRAL